MFSSVCESCREQVLKRRHFGEVWWSKRSARERDLMVAFGARCATPLFRSSDVSCVVPEKSNAIIGVMTAGFECLPSSCDGLTGPGDHGPMISTGLFAVRGSSGNQAGQSGDSLSSSAEITTQSLPAESLSQEQNAVVSTYVNDIVLLSLTPIASADEQWPSAESPPLRRRFLSRYLKPSAEYDDVTDDVISTNPSAERRRFSVCASLHLLIVMTSRLMSSQLNPYRAQLFSSAESSSDHCSSC
ncbi:hypothetical protein F511_12000 [Dorcoceras hygrometricum]|uniref:Uncharacterized protein n=1 Tax=Dorcoceras hygrometricum TaxID=472368 RepID=A0A2Z7D5H1_9LAMI|nr:hypothetical protein F511_12000 [Dorcoceras hygrometricum]